MFNALVIAYYYPPMGLSGVQRTEKFTKYMRQFNWQPTVITTGKTAYYAHDLTLLEEAEKAGVTIKRTESFDPNSVLKKLGTVQMPREFIRKNLSRLSKTIFIPDNKLFWSKKAFKLASNLLKNEHFDVLYVSIPPFSTFSMAAKLKKRFNIPLIVDYRDAWHGNQFAFNPSPYHSYKNKKLEDRALRASDKIIVVNRLIKEKLLKSFQFLTFEDIVILPHGYDPEDFLNVEPIKDHSNKMKILYSGIFYENVTPKYLLQAFKQLTVERPDIVSQIELQFVGHFRKENRNLAKRLGLEQFITEFGYLNHKETIRKIVSADILWVMLGEKNMSAVTPGKLYEYFGSRKPILATLPDGAAKLDAEKYGASFITSPDDLEGIKKMIVNIHSLYENNNLPIPNEDFVVSHNRKFLTESLAKEFQFFLRSEL